MANEDKTNEPAWGPAQPHPLSQLQTELIWEGKYDEYGNRRTVDAAGLAMPMQRIETIDEPRARAEAQGDLFDTQKAHLDDFRNRLIWGDNKLVLASLLHEFKGRVDLIYIDPPFDVGADFTMRVPIGDGTDQAAKDQSALEMVAYRDTWGKGTDSYIHMMYERLLLMRELLSDRGSIFVHCDWRVTHYIRAVLEDVFGRSAFLNEVVWRRSTSHSAASRFGQVHDTIYWFSKGENYTWNPQYRPYSQEYTDRYFRFKDPDGRRYWKEDATGAGGGPARQFGDKEIAPPAGRHWRWTQDKIDKLWADDKFVLTRTGKPEFKRYLDEQEGEPVSDLWDDIKRINMMADERLGFDTQKPEALVQRILETASKEDDLVADFFCGSGTLGAAAEKLGRRWIMADLGRFAIHTSRKRLIEVQRGRHEAGESYRAFDVLNLGRYERQWWQKERLKGADEEHRRIILEFFRAETLPNPPSPLLHGRKGTAFCHVDAIDTIFTRDEAKGVASATSDAGAKQVYCLSWEFEMDLRLECNRLEKELGVEIKLIQIPREIMEKNRKEPPPFLEVATLTAEPIFGEVDGKKAVDVKLTSFIPSLSEVPARELEILRERAVKSGFDFIDFWAVDFDFTNGGPFHHDWQDYRLRKDRSLKTTSEQRHMYETRGTYAACVKVVDIFGSDTSITVEVPYG